MPAWQVSVCVQPLLSLQAVPLGAAGFEQLPSTGSQVPATWHWSDGVQTTGFEPVQTPARQVSVEVQAFASLHVVPSGAVGFEQAPVAGLQVPARWHWSEAVQVTDEPAAQTPARHESPVVHWLPSSQLVPSAAVGFEQRPVDELQVPATWH